MSTNQLGISGSAGPTNTAIIICTEHGRLEKQSLLLVMSLRLFGGAFSGLPVYSFAPRSGHAPSAKTLRLFDFLNVTHETIPLNVQYADYPLANKPIVCDYAQHALSENQLVFIDSDQIIYNEPTLLFNLPDNTVVVKPVDVKGIGTESLDDSVYWKQIYKLFNLTPTEYVRSTIDKKEILA
ncbi:MAG: hypothetical protein HUU10_12710 [Bacteroidetes bacterium]|nr:hypothetical protein [Bacteroidota bacterium]